MIFLACHAHFQALGLVGGKHITGHPHNKFPSKHLRNAKYFPSIGPKLYTDTTLIGYFSMISYYFIIQKIEQNESIRSAEPLRVKLYSIITYVFMYICM